MVISILFSSQSLVLLWSGVYGALKKIFQHGHALFCKNGFRMKLEPIDRIFPMRHCHDFSCL